MRKTHTVRPGETLFSIAKAYYGNEKFAVYIYQHNDALIYDPNRIYSGQILTIPHLPGIRFLA